MKRIMLVLALAVTLVVCLLAFTSCGHQHTWHLEATVDREATCTEAGQKSIKCIDCGEIKEGSVVTIPATHKWGTEFTVDTAATCTTAGSKSVRCTVCLAANPNTVTEIPMTAHSYSAVASIDVLASCNQDGWMSKKCTVCQAPNPDSIIVIPASHAWEELPTVDIEKTCTTDGQISVKCASCGAVDADTVTVVPAGHEWADEATIDTDYTCTTAGQKSVKCTVCQAVDPDSIETLPAAHRAEYVTITEATMFNEGLERGECEVCGMVDDNVIAKTKASVSNLKDKGPGSTTVKKYNIREEIRGTEHFYPTEEHPNGQDFFYEFTFLWNETLARSTWGYIEFGRFANSGGGSGDIPFFLIFKDNLYSSGRTNVWCQYAGGFEIDGCDETREGTDNGIYYGPEIPDGRPTSGITTTKADYPNIGAYGWHRIGIHIHQEVKVVENNVKYELTATLYIDGVMASSYAYEPAYEANLLYHAELVGGNLEYEDVDGGWFYLIRMGDSATVNDQNSYIVLGDISMTVGDSFVLDVEPVENPTAGTYTVGSETLDGTVHFRVK